MAILVASASIAVGFSPSKMRDKTFIPQIATGGSSVIVGGGSATVQASFSETDVVGRYASVAYTGPLSGPSSVYVPANQGTVSWTVNAATVGSTTNGTVTVTTNDGTDYRTYEVAPDS